MASHKPVAGTRLVKPTSAPYMSDMFDFAAQADGDPALLYDDLVAAARAVTDGETDAIANMANVAALLWQFLPDLNWAGFYRHINGELVLGPFQGKAACIRIPLGKGVCGTAAETRKTQLVADVHAFPGHIACDAASASEIVIPIVHDGRLVGVLDLDSPLPARFGPADATGLEALVNAIAARLASA